MSFGKNLQYLRKLCHGMTQEELADRMQVARQTISKWESNAAFPEMEKAIELCHIFSCSMDSLFREDMGADGEAYSSVRIAYTEPMRFACYTVISPEPETDALLRIRQWAEKQNLISDRPNDMRIIGWDFPFVTQEQRCVHHMHGYTAACILPEDFSYEGEDVRVFSQEKARYAVITITEPFQSAFERIPNAYKAINTYMEINGEKYRGDGSVQSCFEWEYEKDGVVYMDVYVALN